MATGQEVTVQFGWFYDGEQFKPYNVALPSGASHDTMQRFTKYLGFDATPMFQRGGKVEVKVYGRARTGGNVMLHGSGDAHYAVIAKDTPWENEPIFVEDFPNLLRLLGELQPFITLFDL
jgi:hypothetical protein